MSTRLIGGVIMTHGDDSGLILPPNIAPHQVVIIPIPRGNWKETVLPKAEAIRDELTAHGIRVKLDADEENSPGWKYAEWELRGVPLRLEIGPKDLEKGQVFSARRDTREKAAIPFDGLVDRVQKSCRRFRPTYWRARASSREEHTTDVATWDEFVGDGWPSGVCDRRLRAVGPMRSRNQGRNPGHAAQYPQASERVEGTCIKCGKPSQVRAWFAKA